MSEAEHDRVIRFHFDYISPYAYLAWTQIQALADRHRAQVEPMPVLFAALLDHHGQKGPAEIPAKRAYLIKDVSRTARRLGVVIAPPPAHPFNPLLGLRLSSLPMPAATRRALVDALYSATWGGGEGITDRAKVAAIATRVGLDADAVARAEQPEAKERVRQQTEDAIAAGTFGVPTMIVGGELFWGLDSLPSLDRFLAGENDVDAGVLARWASLPASAKRPGADR